MTNHGSARLAIPDQWVIDPVSQARLAQQLARQPPEVNGVVALRQDLVPGSSYRVAAELLDARGGEPSTLAATNATGAVLARPGVAVEVGRAGVAVAAGGLLLDPGAAVHDPWRSIEPVEPADPAGQAPPDHRARPVVLLCGLDADPDLADWARRVVNDLVRRDVEGRIAVPAPTPGLHLTRPCAPTFGSVAVLAADVIVALDEPGLELVRHGLGRAIVVELTQDTTRDVEVVAAQPGRTVRARIGRGMDGRGLALLVARLCDAAEA